MKTFTVITAELLHETNTFCALPTTEASFAERGLLFGDAAIAARHDNNTELAGFLDAGRAHGWNLVHVISAHAQPGGRVTRAAFEALTTPIVAAVLAHKGRLDGILLGLHGAMVTDFCEDGEGELLRRLRAQIGHAVPIGITLDPHVNATRAMCDLAEIMVAFKTYPHVDMRAAGRQAGEILQRTMVGEIRPRTLRVSRPMLEEVNGGRTDVGAMVERIGQARAYEQHPDVFAVSVNGGFANADIAEVGPTVLVTAQGNMAAHARFASTLADDFWHQRQHRLNQFQTVTQAAALCKAYAASDQPRPIVVADYADNPGGGAYGDSTALLAALLEAGVQQTCFGPMVDPETVRQLQAHQTGDSVPLRLGGKTDSRFGGLPLEVSCTLRLLSDGRYVGSGAMLGGLHRSWGPTAVVQIDGITVLVVSHRSQMLDLQQFKAFGIDPEAQRIVALKSMQHFRAAFEPIAGEVIVCDSGALCTLDYALLPFAHVPRPLFPFDPDLDYAAWLRDHADGIYIPEFVASAEN
ncbi:M81 family metallopeptidase [Rhodoferax sp.]|uniref:M81 family metallopeptidase n=1 Tax=Rhodoferax sp. TaxID=50421 RepID=UPI00374CCAD6